MKYMRFPVHLSTHGRQRRTTDDVETVRAASNAEFLMDTARCVSVFEEDEGVELISCGSRRGSYSRPKTD